MLNSWRGVRGRIETSSLRYSYVRCVRAKGWADRDAFTHVTLEVIEHFDIPAGQALNQNSADRFIIIFQLLSIQDGTSSVGRDDRGIRFVLDMEARVVLHKV